MAFKPVQDNPNTFAFNTQHFTVLFSAEEEHESLASLMKDWEPLLILSTVRDIEAGRTQVFSAKVSVIHTETGDELSSSYLGACFYKNVADFMDHFGLGLTSMENKLKKARNEKRQKQLQQHVDFIKQNHYNPIGSYFKDMVKEAISEARTAWNDESRQVSLKVA